MKHKNLMLVAITFFFIGLTGLQAQTVRDIDGNVYKTITIGSQVWMAENLKTTKYRNGDLIATTTTATFDISQESSPVYQWAYEGNESNVAIYGRLYTWYAVTDSRNVCPTGWHLPSDTEWITLAANLEGERIAAGKLKETGTTHWLSPNTGATNETGFTALPGGHRNINGTYSFIGEIGYWWSSTEYSSAFAFYRGMNHYHTHFYTSNYIKGFGFSVRCLRDL